MVKKLLPKLFITLVPSARGVQLAAQQRKDTKLIKRYERLDIDNVDDLKNELRKLQRGITISYIVVLETVVDAQGIIYDLEDVQQSLAIDESSVEMVRVAEWGIYLTKDQLSATHKRFKFCGLDLLYSPYSLLHFFYRDQIVNRDGFYTLLSDTMVVGMVFKEGKLLFGDMVAMKHNSNLFLEFVDQDSYYNIIIDMIKHYYKLKDTSATFIEQIYIADSLNLEVRLENRLEEELFVEVNKRSIDISETLGVMAELELEI